MKSDDVVVVRRDPFTTRLDFIFILNSLNYFIISEAERHSRFPPQCFSVATNSIIQ